MLNNTNIQNIFSNLSGKYAIKRTIKNYGYGQGIAYFLPNNANELLYKEELNFNYYGCDNQIFAVKEYKYILENNGITKYFTAPENNLFYQLNFINSDNLNAVGSHLCGEDQYNATYIFLNSDSFTLNYQVLGSQKDYNIATVFNRI